MKKNKRFISIILVVMLIVASSVSAAELETNITITNTVQPTEVNREFVVNYNMTVDATSSVEAPAIVLCVDRSGSMLWSDGDNGLIVDTVRPVIEQFISSYYLHNPGGDLAIISFGTGAVAHDNYKYYNTAWEALEEIDYIYDYFWSSRYYRYEWEHWHVNQGYTNIGEAFEQAAKTVELNKKADPTADDIIVLFSDGVPTTYKSSNDPNSKTGSYPTSHNTSTVYSYTEGQNAQDWADVMTIGYFGGYTYYPQTMTIAQETLDWSQNAGFYTTNELGEVDDIFDRVLNSIEYLGTEALVTEIVNSEFVVDVDSISLSGASVTVDPVTGQTTIQWDLGNLYLTEYDFSYKVKAKDDIYPSGKEDVIVNDISVLGAGLSYVDLDGVSQFVEIPETVIDIPSHEIVPGVELEVYHEYSQSKEYLVGDKALIVHDLMFSNELLSAEIGNVMFDFVRMDVEGYSKLSVTGDGETSVNMNNVFELLSTDWTMNSDGLGYIINETTEADNPEDLLWEKQLLLELECLEEGNYDFLHSISYDLYNPHSDVPFNIVLNNLVEDEIKVNNGTLEMDLNNEFGEGISNTRVLFVDPDSGDILIDTDTHDRSAFDGDLLTVDHIPTGTYDVLIDIPMGYKLPDDHSLTLNEDDMIVLGSQSLNYQNPLVQFAADFITLDVGEISITTAEGESQVFRNNYTDDLDVEMTFRPMSEIEGLRLPIIDTFDYVGDVTIDGSSLVVKDSSGNVVEGFSFSGNTLVFNDAVVGAPDYLDTELYTAEFTITSLPSALSGQIIEVVVNGQTTYKPAPGHTFELAVVESYTTPIGSGLEKQNAATSRELEIVFDEIGPEIVLLPSVTEPTESNITVNVDVLSEYTFLVTYNITKTSGLDANESDFVGLPNVYGFRSFDIQESLKVVGDFEVSLIDDGASSTTGRYYDNGFYSVMAIDQAGNVTIEVIHIDNLINRVQDLL